MNFEADTRRPRGEAIRVLHIVPSLKSGGGERVAVHILSCLQSNRFHGFVASMWSSHNTELDRRLKDAGIPVYHLDKRSGLDPRMFIKLNALMLDLKPHVVHTHLAGLRYTVPALFRSRIPACVHTIHNLADKEVGRIVQTTHRIAFRMGVKPVAIAEKVLDSFESVYGYRDIPLIPNGIPLDTYSRPGPDAANWRAKNGFSSDHVLMVCVARLEPQKNHALLISSFAEGLRDNPDAHLLIVGRDTKFSEALRAAARLTAAEERIHFLGVRSDVPDILHASDIFVLASDYEGNPLTVMEAMAAGLPVVATSVGGVPELVVHEETGLLVDAGNGRAMASRLRQMSEFPAMRQSFGEAGKKRALERFSAETMAERYAALYETLLRNSGTTRH